MMSISQYDEGIGQCVIKSEGISQYDEGIGQCVIK